ncbi:unnamed protein product [Paramecium sonneborni]|uniref:Uncharacterized protein n=1 Tax=Paramecium sonneborni TaxID=65129 RepID=A0A8S1LR73_9CILI|nr:unnamed protein product [Paramecium sonneborni]
MDQRGYLIENDIYVCQNQIILYKQQELIQSFNQEIREWRQMMKIFDLFLIELHKQQKNIQKINRIVNSKSQLNNPIQIFSQIRFQTIRIQSLINKSWRDF